MHSENTNITVIVQTPPSKNGQFDDTGTENQLTNFKVSSQGGESEHIHFILLPFLTWGFVAKGLASGVLSFIGGKIFSAAFSNTPDIGNVVQNAVVEMEDFIITQLEKNFLDECNRRVSALYNLLQEYHNAPEHSEDRLTKITNDSNDLMFLLKDRGTEATFIFVLATSLHIIALYTRYLRYKDAGELTNIKNTIVMASGKSNNWLDAVNTLIANIASPINMNCESTHHRGWSEYHCYATFAFKGENHIYSGRSSGPDYVEPGRGHPPAPHIDYEAPARKNALDQATASRDNLISEFKKHAQDVLLNPAYATLDDWNSIKQKLAHPVFWWLTRGVFSRGGR